MQRIDGQNLNIRFRQDQIDEIYRIAAKRKMKKVDVVRMMLDAGLGCHKDLERVGLIQLFDLVSWAKEASKEKAKEYEATQLELF